MGTYYDHKTDQYNWNSPVYRRGFPIPFISWCDDCENIKNLSIILKTGRISNSRSSKEFRINYGYETSGWTVNYETTTKRNNVKIILNSPSNAIIGQYYVNIYLNGRLRLSKHFLLFFNPWCQNDSVYLEDENQRYEYIQNTHTIIYMGTYSHISSRGWYLAQFQPYSIEAVLILLDRMNVEDRSSPIAVSRFLSAIVNANDDNGIVNGNWSGNYKSGINPNAWNGSGNILAKFAKYRAPVRYGQCWVFCGVLCSVLRTCGIPSRCITTYNSFHDLDGSLAWEMYFNRFLRPVIFKRQESMWNFHCWNEAWMDRKDLSPGYGGWQIVDGTPQERSKGIYRLGPASKMAVKEGNVDFPYDTGFVFAEVNADKIFYYQRPRGGFVIGRIDSQVVGRSISTKAIGSNQRVDLTSTYKYADDSQAERIIQKKIQMKTRRYRDIPRSSIRIEINPPKCAIYNNDCLINFRLINLSQINSRFKFRLNITSITYRGRINGVLNEQLYEIIIPGQTEKNFSETIKASLLTNISSNYSMIKIEIIGIVNGQDFVQSEAVIDIDRPRISIEGVPDVMMSGETYKLRIAVVNPFYKTLTNVKIYLNGDVILNGRLKIMAGNISSLKSFYHEFDVFSTKRGDFYIYASLSSNETAGFDQYLSLTFQ